MNKGLWFGKRAVTELVPLTTFYPAEAYHQRYFARNPSQPYCAIIVAPKLQVCDVRGVCIGKHEGEGFGHVCVVGTGEGLTQKAWGWRWLQEAAAG